MVRFENGATHEFEYDRAGNLLKAPGLSARVQAGNRLLEANDSRFTYNDRDHVATREARTGKVTYTYDSRDLLVGIEGPDFSYRAVHDGLGRRTQKTVNGQTWHYYWDTGRLAAEVFPNGHFRIYVYPDAFALVPILFLDYADLTTGKRYHVHTDHLGCPELVLDDAGHTAWRAHIDPYGTAHVDVGQDFHQPLRWPGHYFDSETGLHDNRFRTYSPELGRYLQSDPTGTEGGVNLYAYTENPLRAVDLRGNEQSCPEGTKNCPFKKEGGEDKEGTVKRAVSDAEPGKTLSDGTPMPPGTKKVTYSDGKHSAHYYVDSKARTIRAEVPVRPPADYTKKGVGHINPEGRVSGRDDRGHLGGERGAPNQKLVNQRENVIAEHGTESNRGPKKAWENSANKEATNNPNSNYTSVHEPKYDGDNPRPYEVHHELHKNGTPLPNHTQDIDNPET